MIGCNFSMHINECKIIDFPEFVDSTGSLTFVEGMNHFDFVIHRIYYLTRLTENSIRGGHAHKALYQVVIPISGSFEVCIDDGINSKRVRLTRPNQGLLITPFIWRTLEQFSLNAICLVLASDRYNEDDYIRNYESFRNIVISNSNV